MRITPLKRQRDYGKADPSRERGVDHWQDQTDDARALINRGMDRDPGIQKDPPAKDDGRDYEKSKGFINPEDDPKYDPVQPGEFRDDDEGEA